MRRLGNLARVVALLMPFLGWVGGASAQPDAMVREEMHRVPVQRADGIVQMIPMRLCLPRAGSALPLAMLHHGMPRDDAERARLVLFPCDAEPVRWFLREGFAVGMPLRRGYGPEGGAWAEAFYCRPADFRTSAGEAARDMEAALGYASTLPDIDATRPALVIGLSAGGWGALGLASRNPAGVGAILNFAGGIGGRAGWTPNTNCGVETLVKLAGAFGTTARVPSLWLYAANDSFFSPEIATAMHQAFTAGGGLAELVLLPAWGSDGHRLFFAPSGSETWGPIVASFLRKASIRHQREDTSPR